MSASRNVLCVRCPNFITAHTRSVREGNVFTLSGTGQVPPIPPHPDLGQVPPTRTWDRYPPPPPPGPGTVPPPLVMFVTLSGTRQVPPTQTWHWTVPPPPPRPGTVAPHRPHPQTRSEPGSGTRSDPGGGGVGSTPLAVTQEDCLVSTSLYKLDWWRHKTKFQTRVRLLSLALCFINCQIHFMISRYSQITLKIYVKACVIAHERYNR